jgi:arylsulfate sulfotransferase
VMPDGNMLINYSGQQDGENSLLEEIDLAGDVVWQLTAADLNSELATAGFDLKVVGSHHDMIALPNGHLIVIAATQKDFTNLVGLKGTTTVTGDVLIDLDTSRQPVWIWSEFDHLDVNRHPLSFPDWTHSNAVIYSPDDGNLIVSIRHQHWVIKVDYQDGKGSGDVVWKLGWQGDFQLQGGSDPTDWFYAPHSPYLASPNSSGVFDLGLFDNGNIRPIGGYPCSQSGKPSCYSRIPIFRIDEIAKTATIIWQDTLPVYSFFGGYVQTLGNGNVEFDEAAATSAPKSAAIFEVSPDATPQTIWQMLIKGQYAYRAFRIPSLYPGVQW